MANFNAYITDSDLIEFEKFKASKSEIPLEIITESQLIIDGTYFPWLVN